jgi:hypothetical protein
MRTWISIFAAGALALMAAPAYSAELTFTLDSYTGSGSPTNLDASLGTCLAPNCVLFTGTLTDNDVDPQPDLDPTYLFLSVPYTGASPYNNGMTDQTVFDGSLSLDYTLLTPAVLSGDTDADDLNPPTSLQSVPIFGVDIPVGTPVGTYTDTVYIDVTSSLGNTFTVSATATVDVLAPEPSSSGLLLAGLTLLASGYGVKRRWLSFGHSR